MKSLSPLLFYADVPRKYDFDKEEVLNDKKTYGYEFFKTPIADGLLISKTMLEVRTNVTEEKKKFTICPKSRIISIKYGNVRDFLHLKKKILSKYITFADPGTWSYVHSKKLPDFLFDTERVFNYYNSLRYDLCGSVDHPIIDKIRYKDENGKTVFHELSDKEKNYRVNLTIDLSKEFIKFCTKKKKILNFMPFGTVQGYDETSYIYSLKKTLKLGYKYIAIGGLPGYSEKRVIELLIPIKKTIDKYKKHNNIGLHLYGRFPSPDAVYPFARAGVTTFDNNSGYITASRTNCTVFDSSFLVEEAIKTPNNSCYNIRIPSVRSKIFYKFRKISFEKELEYQKTSDLCYKKFVRYGHNFSEKRKKKFLKSYESLWLLIKEVDSKLTDKKVSNLVEKADFTLKSNVWERCGCSACERAGVHITLTRGHPRIPYTFFHNSHVQYARLQKELKNPEIQKYTKLYNWNGLKKIRIRNGGN